MVRVVAVILALVLAMTASQVMAETVEEVPADCGAYQEASPDVTEPNCGSDGELPEGAYNSGPDDICPEGWTSDGPNTLCYVDQEANDDSEVIDDGGHQAWREGDRGRCPDHLDAERCEFWQQGTEFADAEGNCPDGMEYIPAHLTEIGFGHCQVIAVGTPDTGGSDSGESETDGVVEVVTPEAETEIEAEEVEPAESESASDPSQIGQEALTLEPPAQVDQVEAVTDEVVDTSSTLIVESVEEAAPQYEQSEFEVTALPSTGTGSQNESTMEAVVKYALIAAFLFLMGCASMASTVMEKTRIR